MGYIQPFLCLFVAVAVTADYQGPSSYRRPQTSYGTPAPWYGGTPNRGSGDGYRDDERPKSYQFGYAVRDSASGNDFGRHETSDGDTVQGQYRVQLPDGRTQIVTYTADWQNGFQADVKYEGEAFYPDKNSNYGNNYNNNNNDYNNYNNYNNNHQHGGHNYGNSGYRDYNNEPYRKSGSSFGQDSYGNSGSSYHSKGSSHGHYNK